MRSLLIASVLLIAVGVSAVPKNPFLLLQQTRKDGKVQVVVKNVSKKPIVAYVVVGESANHRSVWHGVYTGKDALAAGDTATVGDVTTQEGQIKAFVDYVRLADGTSWGDATTDDAKEISSRFQQQ